MRIYFVRQKLSKSRVTLEGTLEAQFASPLPFLENSPQSALNISIVIITEEQARNRIDALPQGMEPRIKWAGFNLPGEVADGNLLVAGTIGSGKTRIQQELLQSLLPYLRPGSDRKAVIFDTKGDLSEKMSGASLSSRPLNFSSPGNDLSAWDFAADITSPADAQRLAHALIEAKSNEGTPFFTNAARDVLAKLILALKFQQPANFNLATIIRMASSRQDLERALSSVNGDPYPLPASAFADVQTVIASSLNPLEATANLWEHTERKVSLRRWVSHGNSPLILTGDDLSDKGVATINRTVLSHIADFILSEPNSATSSRFWIFIDDLNGAGRLDSLLRLLNARSHGVRCAVSVTDLDGLCHIYGERAAVDTIIGNCSTVAFLKLASASTASWASQRTGNDFRPSEFLNLPRCGSENVSAVHLIRGLSGTFRATTKI